LPHRVHTDNPNGVDLYLRVAKPYGKVKFTVSSGNEILATAIRLHATPGEMEKLTIKANKLPLAKETITVGLEELE
jgi:hypothetical protein